MEQNKMQHNKYGCKINLVSDKKHVLS